MKMWSQFVSLMILFSIPMLCYGQISPTLYGDEWINEDQTYYKFQVAEEGIYRLTAQTLAAAGIDIAEIDVDRFQLYTLGEEVPLRITSSDNLGDADYIEFYAEANDGSVDALLYADADGDQLNPFISLYSDKRPYYLTWTLHESTGKRYSEKSNGLNGNGLPPKEPYYIHREIITYDNFHHKPTHDGRNFIRYSSMDISEGYGSPLAESSTIKIEVDRLSPFGVDPRVIIRFGTNVLSRNWKISNDTRDLKFIPQNGYGVVDIDERFPLHELHEGLYNIHIDPIKEDDQKHTLARLELHYPRRYEFDGEVEIEFIQQASIISRYIELEGFGGSQPILYNLTDQSYVLPGQEGANIMFVTPSALQEQAWRLVDLNQGVHEVDNLEKKTFETIESSADYVIISHDELITSGAIDQYADYRSSEVGGSYNTTILDIDDLVERYAYGIEGHPIAIKSYMRQLRDQSSLPDYTFLIGKGREYTEIKEEKETTALVPTFGIPGSDNLFMAFDDKRHPQRAIGRLAAQQPEDVTNYLDKIITHETRTDEQQTIEEQAWKKSVIHLSGGSASNQATLFRFLNDMGGVISNNTFGADVTTFRKTSADPLQRVTTDQIVSEIDKGSALLTFFGHSAVGTFDFSLEDPSKYNNQGRNPIILSLGCHSGNIHTVAGGISEDFILEKEKGAIAFIASSGTAYPEPQYFTGINLYDLIGGEMYGQPIGDILQQSLEARTDNPSLSVQTLIEQLTLHGDPAYRFGAFEGPDYSINQESVTIAPGILNATTPQFTLQFEVINLGATRDEVLDIEIVHLLPDGTPIDTQIVEIPAPAFSSEVIIDLDNPGDRWVGSNRILINVDPAKTIEESPNAQAESNNELIGQDGEKGIGFFVFDNSAKPISPQEFGIYGGDIISLSAAVNNGLSPGGQFIIQIDTTQNYDSPLMRETTIDNQSSIIQWTPNIDAIEDAVYYWRISPVAEDDRLKTENWQSSSFVYIPDHAPGWNQSHFYQWQENSYYKVQLGENRRLNYSNREWDIRIKNEIRDEGDFWVYINSTPWASLNPRSLGSLVSIFAWDPQNVIFSNSGSDFGSIPFTSDGFLYDMTKPDDIHNIVTLLDNIPDGARVFFHTMLDNDTTSLFTQLWDEPTTSGPSIMDKLEEQGATRVRELLEKGTVPYTYIYDKGNGPIVEDIANNIYETVDLTSKAQTIWSEGVVSSVPLGDRGRWLRLQWSEEKENADLSRVLVLGIKPGGQKDTLKVVENDYDVNLTSINPAIYPKLELAYETSDEEDKTAAQLKFWRVITNELPDAAFYAEATTFEIVDTLDAGEVLSLDYDLVNLTEEDMGPVLIRYTLIDEDFKEKIIVKRSDALPGQDTINILQSLSTDLLAGHYQIVIEINPNEDQAEMTDCNNLGFANFYVRPDKRNPFLDVTFDGRHITNGEVINQTPEIVVTLRDEDSFLLLDNPEDFEITLFYPQLLEWKAKVNTENVTWLPSSSIDRNVAAFILHPDLNQEGTYTLEVQAKDIAGNKAGSQKYRISFEVNFSSDIPSLVISPNPMDQIVEFKLYVDSDQSPEEFSLNIYSTDGKLVKQVGREGFGGLKRGINTYLWNGRSDGDTPLPSGLYFYHIYNSGVARKEQDRGSIFKL